MADSRFFKNNGPFTLEEIAKISSSSIAENAKPSSSKKFIDVAPLDSATENHISFLDNTKYIESFSKSKAGAAIVREKFKEKAPSGMLLLFSENPYLSFAKITTAFYPEKTFDNKISEKAFIHPSAKIGKDSTISSGAFIGENVKISENVFIGPNCFIDSGVEIGKNSIIHANASITCSVIGNNVIIHSGCRIGQDGFGYAFDKGTHYKVPQIGNVIIEDEVEIGANTCIDRGSSGDTVIGRGTKIDNLVQIGHNVKLGKGCIIVAQVGISGSTKFGDYVVVGGQAGFAGHLNIGAGAKFAAQSGVAKDVAPGEALGGTPAVAIKDFHRQSALLKKLIKKQSAEN